jgi:glutamate/aspartate transport system substrate-binding protein
MMLPKNDLAFKQVVDEAIAQAETSEAAKLYQKWFISPIPPNDLNLNLPPERRDENTLQKPK